jgi:hypothetical protein
MFRQSGIPWLDLLRAPRIGIGFLGLSMAGAFIIGGLSVALVVGNRPASGASNTNIVAANPVAPVTVAAPIRRELLVGDFAPPAQISTRESAPAQLHRERLVGDFAPPLQTRTSAGAPQRLQRELLVDDFGR